MNNLELKAIITALGLEAQEFCDIKGVDIKKRNLNYMLSGSVAIKHNIAEIALSLKLDYDNMLNYTMQDVEKWHKDNPKLETDNAEEYAKWVKNRPRLVMPFYKDFELFCEKHEQKHVTAWRMYRAVVSDLYLKGLIDGFDDSVVIDTDSKTAFYLNELPRFDL